ncbi:TPA: hypothetical protein HA265_05290, partial [Candidatus Woesearchaeota archaeon]|nr:hypothetical protein [Candidatus Woesearchaeota archaeon]
MKLETILAAAGAALVMGCSGATFCNKDTVGHYRELFGTLQYCEEYTSGSGE